MDHRHLGLFVLVAGLVLAGVGALIWTGALSWFGRLPGDLRIQTDHTRIYIPITTMILLSLLLTLILYLLRK